ncbi:MAG: DUF3209 family protein [Planctomycetales bacterium]|nr:DUF3209 family protein [Planctomycetales bacterium]
MACHEIGALRLGLMKLLGRSDEAERQHELAELGAAAREAGPLRSLSEAADLASLRRLFRDTVSDLAGRAAVAPRGDPALPYLQTLVVLTKSVERELDRRVEDFGRLYRDLEELHDFVHEIYPKD